MESNTNLKSDKDPDLWKTAQKRASFKYHMLIYFIMNIFFWTLWYINLKNDNSIPVEKDSIPWPVWPMFGWGIGIFFQYISVYKNSNALAEKEYKKLKNK